MHHSFHQKIKQHKVLLIITLIIRIVFLSRILGCFLRDHVTLKTGGKMVKIQHCHHRNKVLKCIFILNINIEYSYFKL